MNSKYLPLLALGCGLAHSVAANPLQGQQPNIIMMLADDLGYADLNQEMTPFMYELAQTRGIQFDLSSAASCTPSRAALLTGADPTRYDMHGVSTNPRYSTGLPNYAQLLPEALKTAGYVTGVFGKWHLGGFKEADETPDQQGFDEAVYLKAGHINSWGYSPDGISNGSWLEWGHSHHGSHDIYTNDEQSVRSEQYSTHMFRDTAVSFIQRHANTSPFFMYVPFNAPHGPFSAPRETVDLFAADYGFDKATVDTWPHAVGNVVIDDYWANNDKTISQVVYSAMVHEMDSAVRDIWNALEEQGVADNTVLVFASDNGAGVDVGSNAPAKGFKGTPYEGGIRSANFAVWPGVSPGKETTAPIWLGDFMPTFIAAAGADPVDGLDGADLTPLLSGEADTVYRPNWGEFFVPHVRSSRIGSAGDTVVDEIAIRKGQFKYIYKRYYEVVTYAEKRFEEELYDLNADVGEAVNLVTDEMHEGQLSEFRSFFTQVYGGNSYLRRIFKFHSFPGAWAGYTAPREFAHEELDALPIYNPVPGQWGRVAGSLVSDDKPVVGAKVQLSDSDNNKLTTFTNKSGYFTLVGIPAGEYSVSFPRYERAPVMVESSNNDTQDMGSISVGALTTRQAVVSGAASVPLNVGGGCRLSTGGAGQVDPLLLILVTAAGAGIAAMRRRRRLSLV